MTFCVSFANTLGVLSNGLHFKYCEKIMVYIFKISEKISSNFEGKPKDIIKTSDTGQSLNKHSICSTVAQYIIKYHKVPFSTTQYPAVIFTSIIKYNLVS